jgi:transposase-like protein
VRKAAAKPAKPKAAPAKVGRPTKLTEALVRDIAEAVAEGMTYTLAAQLHGVTRKTLYNWLKAGEDADGESPEAEFLHALKKAEAEGARVQLRRVRGGEMNWQSGAWLLERRFRDDYGAPKVKHEHSGKDGGPIEHTVEERRRDAVGRMLEKAMKLGISEDEARASLLQLGVDARDLDAVRRD